jgi:hypothetical protein
MTSPSRITHRASPSPIAHRPSPIAKTEYAKTPWLPWIPETNPTPKSPDDSFAERMMSVNGKTVKKGDQTRLKGT